MEWRTRWRPVSVEGMGLPVAAFGDPLLGGAATKWAEVRLARRSLASGKEGNGASVGECRGLPCVLRVCVEWRVARVGRREAKCVV
jgi:hypothetical protein